MRTQLLEPKMDIVFQALFKKGNENITKALISEIIGKKIQKIDLDKNKNLLREYAKDKMGVLDLVAILDDGMICNIEMQVAEYQQIDKRLLYYHSKLYSQQMLVGDKYDELEKTISIAILNYNLKQLNDIPYGHTIWHIREDETNDKILTNQLELHIIEIPKIKRMIENGKHNKLIDWIMFLDNPNNEEVSKIMRTNKEIEEAMRKLEEISGDEELMRLVDLRRKAILDENQLKYEANVLGREEGRKVGIEEGRVKGRKQEKIDIAKRALENEIDIKTIILLTGLTENEIIEIKNNIK